MSRTGLWFTMTLVLGAVLLGSIWPGNALAQSKAPQRPSLSQDKLNTFLNGKHNAILATIKKDGSPQLTPVWYRWDCRQL